MNGILHWPKAFSKNSGVQRPAEPGEWTLPFERAALPISPHHPAVW